jgi:hypothetical protein
MSAMNMSPRRFASVNEMLLFSAVESVIAEERIACLCGVPPYDDGIQCPKCFCITTAETVDELTAKKRNNA